MRLLLSDAAFSPEDLAVYRDAICRPRAAWAGLAYFRSIAHTIKDDFTRLRGKRITSPALILWGERDRMLRRDLTRWLDRQFTNPARQGLLPRRRPLAHRGLPRGGRSRGDRVPRRGSRGPAR